MATSVTDDDSERNNGPTADHIDRFVAAENTTRGLAHIDAQYAHTRGWDTHTSFSARFASACAKQNVEIARTKGPAATLEGEKGRGGGGGFAEIVAARRFRGRVDGSLVDSP